MADDGFIEIKREVTPMLTSMRLPSHGGLRTNHIDVGLWKSGSVFNPKTGRHELSLQLSSAVPFTLDKGVVNKTEGEFKRQYGGIIARSKIADTFRFMELPIELRMMIYEMVLYPDSFGKFPDEQQIPSDDDELDMWSHNYYSDDEDNSNYDDDYYYDSEDEEYAWTVGQSEPWKRPRVTFKPCTYLGGSNKLTKTAKALAAFRLGQTNILYVSKQVSAEAASVLYELPTFSFDHIDICNNFIVTIGKHGQSLRRLEISDGFTLSGASALGRSLICSPQLQSLKLICNENRLEAYWPEFAPRAFKALVNLYKVLFQQGHDVKTALAIVHFEFNGGFCSKSSEADHTCNFCDRHNRVVKKFEEDLLELANSYYQLRVVVPKERERQRVERLAKQEEDKLCKKIKASKQTSAKSRKRRRNDIEREDYYDESRVTSLHEPGELAVRRLPKRKVKSMSSYEEVGSDSETLPEPEVHESQQASEGPDVLMTEDAFSQQLFDSPDVFTLDEAIIEPDESEIKEMVQEGAWSPYSTTVYEPDPALLSDVVAPASQQRPQATEEAGIGADGAAFVEMMQGAASKVYAEDSDSSELSSLDSSDDDEPLAIVRSKERSVEL